VNETNPPARQDERLLAELRAMLGLGDDTVLVVIDEAAAFFKGSSAKAELQELIATARLGIDYRVPPGPAGAVIGGVPADQAWFWTAAWQAGEREASAEIAAGGLRVYGSAEEMLADLDRGDAS
jgi:hypothetical protein